MTHASTPVKTAWFRTLVGTTVLVIGLLTSFLAPALEVLPRWQTYTAGSTVRLDNAAYDAFLSKYRTEHADGVVRVDYGAVTAADRAALQGYLERLQGTDVDALDRPEQMAFWLNLYNAATIELILAHYPTETIRDIRFSLFAFGPWRHAWLTVAGTDLSLDDVEHRILRPIWRDPRIHYGVNCASYGCPNLAPVAFDADNLEKLLEAGARAYVNHPRGASVDEGGRLTVSSIYDWFVEDFGHDDAGVIAHLRRYAGPDLAARLVGIDRIHRDRYDWALNDTATAPDGVGG